MMFFKKLILSLIKNYVTNTKKNIFFFKVYAINKIKNTIILSFKFVSGDQFYNEIFTKNLILFLYY